MANCCFIDVDYDDRPVISDGGAIKARKEHACIECRKTIRKGDIYENQRCLYRDSGWSTFKTCARCSNVRREYFKGGWYYGSLVDDFQNCFGFDYRDGIPKDFAPCKGKP